MPKVLIPADTTTGYIGTASGIKSLGLAVGMTGAIQPSRYAGATTSGAPATGTFIAGDFTIDLTGAQWVCTAGGTPGTWAKIASVGATAAGASAVGDTATAGTGGTASRVDHVHAREAFAAPSALTVSQAQTSGTAVSISRSDHQHAMPGSGIPVAVTGGATASAGSGATTLALSDHVHSTAQLAILNATNTFTTSLTVSAGSVTRSRGSPEPRPPHATSVPPRPGHRHRAPTSSGTSRSTRPARSGCARPLAPQAAQRSSRRPAAPPSRMRPRVPQPSVIPQERGLQRP